MPRDYKQQLDDIIQAITFIREYVKDMDYKAFEADTKTQHAVIHNLEVIGEAARSMPDEVKDNADEIEWDKIIALRNILIHEYFGVNLKIVWDVVHNKLDALETTCRKLLQLGRVRFIAPIMTKARCHCEGAEGDCGNLKL